MSLTENLFHILLGQWSSGYDVVLIVGFFDEKIDDIFHDLTNIYFLFFNI
jgi:hypothetical protein